ncbi:MAG: alkaline phosphatase family protein, partial [Thermoplasmata archaeon]
DTAFGLYPALENGTLAPNVTVPNNLGNASSEFTCPGLYPTGESCPADQIQVVPNGTFDTADPGEGYAPSHVDWNNGQMDGWLLPGGSGVNALNTYSIAQMAPEWVLAQEYALGDNYYASALTETTPNRLFAIAGYSPVTNDYGPPPYVPYDRTIFSELAHYGLTSGYYLDNPSSGTGILGFIAGQPANSPSIRSYSQFESESRDGTLPTLSWVLPLFGGLYPTTYSQHPPGSVLAGEMWFLYMIKTIMAGKDWNSTVIVLNYDEGGEYYDHVAPPYLDGAVLGERVPQIVVSPYSKEDYVSHTILNHASWIAFLDNNWGVPALNGFVADSNLPLDLFDFVRSPRAPDPWTAAQG